jgi:hypothetical protein
MQESGHDGIRMERLFDVFLLTHRSTYNIHWATEQSTRFYHKSQKITDAFYRNLNEFGLVLCKSTVVQCTRRSLSSRIGIPPSPEEIVKEIIIGKYREHGLDVDLRRKNIEESELKRGEPVFCDRRYR